jgi:hypothetical protein
VQPIRLFRFSSEEACVNMGSLGLSGTLKQSGNQDVDSIRGGHEQARSRCLTPLVYSGSLDTYPHKDVTPVIGREFDGLQVIELLESSQSDQLIKDLATTGKGLVLSMSKDL